MSGTAAKKKRPLPGAAAVGRIVTIIVDTSETKYYVHQAFLVHYSEYFKKALCGSFTEAREGIIKMKDVERLVFDIFLGWVYGRTLQTIEEEWEEMQDQLNASDVDYYDAMLKVYVFADRFLVPELKVTVLDFFYDLYNNKEVQGQIYSGVVYAFKNLPTEDPLLQMMVDVQCALWQTSDDNQEEVEYQDKLSHQFLLRVMHRYSFIVRENEGWNTLDICDYHGHKTDKERSECEKSRTKEEDSLPED